MKLEGRGHSYLSFPAICLSQVSYSKHKEGEKCGAPKFPLLPLSPFFTPRVPQPKTLLPLSPFCFHVFSRELGARSPSWTRGDSCPSFEAPTDFFPALCLLIRFLWHKNTICAFLSISFTLWINVVYTKKGIVTYVFIDVCFKRIGHAWFKF